MRVCKVCGRSDVPLEWCGVCGVFICNRCKYRPLDRGIAAVKEAARKVFGRG